MSASGDGIDYRVGHQLKQEFGHQHKQFSIDAIMNKKKQTLQIGKTFFLRDFDDKYGVPSPQTSLQISS